MGPSNVYRSANNIQRHGRATSRNNTHGALTHPQVISIFTFLNGVKYTFVIHEAGTFLHKILYSAPAFDIKTSVSCALQVAQGMSFLHGEGVSFGFRDFPLKTNHILVTEVVDGVPKTLKVGDFRLNKYEEFSVINDKANEFCDVWSFAVFIYVFTTRTQISCLDWCSYMRDVRGQTKNIFNITENASTFQAAFGGVLL